ncbi:MAG TPA: Crp/Fnr family transcriptional regulator [Nevskiaceae bacterium]|nr:Crp/Fnr family transcriptional regulator [Nevskiaceae bacterium]
MSAAGVTVEYVYFPVDAMVSVLGRTDGGGTAEIALVGSEGMTGISVFMGAADTTNAVVQTSGLALRMAASTLSEAFNRTPSVRQLMLRYMQVMLSQAAQNVVCNRHHTVEQQLCRRLLAVMDHARSHELNMTQESIANFLGVRRAGINEAATRLQKLGLVRYARGRITVLDRKGLERRTCECYVTIRNEFDRLFPTRPPERAERYGGPGLAGLAHPPRAI